MKIVISAFWYGVAIAQYFRNALERRKDVELFVAGPYFGDWIPWDHGMYLDHKYIRPVDFALPTKDNTFHPRIIENRLPWKPDLWIHVDAGLKMMQKPNCKTVVIGTDSHVLNDWYNHERQFVDQFYNMQKIYCKGNDKYLSYCYDPGVHFHVDLPKEYDACMIGINYPQRDKLVNALRKEGLNVYYKIGDVYDIYRHKYNASKVGLNWSSLQDVNARVFEMMGMKVPLITNRLPDMKEHFIEGQHYLGFDNIDEAVQMVKLALEHYDRSLLMAENAYNVVKDVHTYDARIEKILKDMEMI